jgi:hypothetical protein
LVKRRSTSPSQSLQARLFSAIHAASPTSGLLLCAGGLVAMRGVDPHGSWTHLIPGLVVWGAGSGLVNPTTTFATLAVVPPRARPRSSCA